MTLEPALLKSSLRSSQMPLHSSKLPWKWRRAFYKTSILYIGPSISFHVNLDEGRAFRSHPLKRVSKASCRDAARWRSIISSDTQIIKTYALRASDTGFQALEKSRAELGVNMPDGRRAGAGPCQLWQASKLCKQRTAKGVRAGLQVTRQKTKRHAPAPVMQDYPRD